MIGSQTSRKGDIWRSSSSDLIGSCTGLRENCECGMCFIIADEVEKELEHEGGTDRSIRRWGTRTEHVRFPSGVTGRRTRHLYTSSLSAKHPSESSRSGDSKWTRSDKVYWQVADARRRASEKTGLFKVDSAGKRRLLYRCHLSWW